jgi:uncharacterized protein with FMN-binding domain
MRRAVIATAGTVAGLALLLGYKSSGPIKAQKVQLGSGQSAAATVPPASSSSTGAQSTPSTAPPATGAPATTTPATSPTTAAPTTSAAQRTYTGPDVTYFYGDIEVSVTLQGGKILNVSVPLNNAIDGRSQQINSYAVPVLEQEVVSAQGLNINAVSGATFTSDAFAQSLQSALSRAGK